QAHRGHAAAARSAGRDRPAARDRTLGRGPHRGPAWPLPHRDLVERHSRYVVLHLRRSRTDDVIEILTATVAELPEELRGTLTWDQGNEMTKHAQFTGTTGIPVYFCEPRSPWQRGSNE